MRRCDREDCLRDAQKGALQLSHYEARLELSYNATKGGINSTESLCHRGKVAGDLEDDADCRERNPVRVIRKA